MKTPPTVSAQEWDAAWEQMLVKEKQLTRARDALAAARRRMPWMAVEKDYRFEGPDGPASPLDLAGPEIERYKERMGWEGPWYTITDDFDRDFGVAEWHGANAFYRDEEDRIFRTYFVNARGDEALGSTWPYLDIAALGRQEDWEDSPPGHPQTEPYSWWRLHDEYEG